MKKICLLLFCLYVFAAVVGCAAPKTESIGAIAKRSLKENRKLISFAKECFYVELENEEIDAMLATLDLADLEQISGNPMVNGSDGFYFGNEDLWFRVDFAASWVKVSQIGPAEGPMDYDKELNAQYYKLPLDNAEKLSDFEKWVTTDPMHPHHDFSSGEIVYSRITNFDSIPAIGEEILHTGYVNYAHPDLTALSQGISDPNGYVKLSESKAAELLDILDLEEWEYVEDREPIVGLYSDFTIGRRLSPESDFFIYINYSKESAIINRCVSLDSPNYKGKDILESKEYKIAQQTANSIRLFVEELANS